MLEKKICYSKSNANWLQPFQLRKLRVCGEHTGLQGEFANQMQLEPLMSFYLPASQVYVYVCAHFWKSAPLYTENSDESQEEES